jgi:hypothetical protein
MVMNTIHNNGFRAIDADQSSQETLLQSLALRCGVESEETGLRRSTRGMHICLHASCYCPDVHHAHASCGALGDGPFIDDPHHSDFLERPILNLRATET